MARSIPKALATIKQLDGRVLLQVATIVLFLGWFAIQFAEERLFSDSSYYLFHVVNDGRFHIEHGRWVLALSQLLPLLGTKLGLPLTTLITLHSLNNVVFLIAGLLFVLGVLRDHHAALALASVQLIGLTHGLFCPIFELYYGVALLIIFRAVVKDRTLHAYVRWPLLSVLFLGAVSSHFLGMLLTIGSLVMDRCWQDRKLTILLASVLLVHIVAHTLTLSAYEEKNLHFIQDLGDATKLLGLVGASRLGELAHSLIRHYPDITVFGTLTLFVLISKKHWWQVLIFTGILFVLFVLVGLHTPGFLHDRYREQLHFAFTAWVIITMCHQVLPLGRYTSLIGILFGCAVVLRIAMALDVSRYYAARTAWHRACIEVARTAHLSKGIIPAPFDFGPADDLVDLSWSTSVESLLLSASAGPDQTISLITFLDEEHEDNSAHLDEFIFRRWEIMDTSALNTVYFRPPTGRYTRIDFPMPRKI
ncbi:MAG TPA: hypothetical protein PL070_07160 [Flavobacteriales bacterium]|nr:hypothetical protein [Flavobacteriales bacterium]